MARYLDKVHIDWEMKRAVVVKLCRLQNLNKILVAAFSLLFFRKVAERRQRTLAKFQPPTFTKVLFKRLGAFFF